jgi:hypothetical protein
MLQRLISHNRASVIQAVIDEYGYEENDYEDEKVRNIVKTITLDVKNNWKLLFSIFIHDCNAEAPKFSNYINFASKRNRIV